MNDLEIANDNEEVFTQCIMFDSSFRSPKKGGAERGKQISNVPGHGGWREAKAGNGS